VTFSISQKPSWANFDADTGALTGTPTVNEEGMTGSITITASDSGVAATIGPFTIDVTAPAPPPAAGTATLTWTAPKSNTDGSPVTGLAGYHVYYGTSPDALTKTIDIAGPTSTTYVVSDLSSGTYYFAVSAYNASGIESAQSNVASKTI
jgi:hypothetical protein